MLFWARMLNKLGGTSGGMVWLYGFDTTLIGRAGAMAALSQLERQCEQNNRTIVLNLKFFDDLDDFAIICSKGLNCSKHFREQLCSLINSQTRNALLDKSKKL